MKIQPRDGYSQRRVISNSGLFLFVAGFLIFMGIMTGEMLYTLEFTTRNNYISELASALPLGTPTPQPSGTIFNLSMMLGGVLIMLASILTFIAYRRLLTTVLILMFGVGLLGVGIFPGNVTPWHGIFAHVIFLAGGLGAITSFSIVGKPLCYVLIVLGIISLVILFSSKYLLEALGVGGVERWVFYPQVFWLMGLGGYLLGKGMQSKRWEKEHRRGGKHTI